MCSIASVLYFVLILHIVVYTEKPVQMTGSSLNFRITLKIIDCSQKKICRYCPVRNVMKETQTDSDILDSISVTCICNSKQAQSFAYNFIFTHNIQLFLVSQFI